MKKFLILIILGSLLSACQTTGDHGSDPIDNPINQMTVTVKYGGRDIKKENVGSKQEDGSYLIRVNISPRASIGQFIDKFHQQTGLAKSHTFWGGSPDNRHSTEVACYHLVNGKFVDDDDADDKLIEFGISNGSVVELGVTCMMPVD